ncbi:hypothetical protein [Sphingomonas solaris]|uniref:Uncharacterized protein n=1 Tax=Alterirhizorhabdus solaris TaxID=2529389 RepID=A0A558R2U4_9SPHN|nr:hypothetical protein [Sphingomonas solaris]TVV73687.1 hypothetical protein FOY91_11575 [Sphingomonas solaris]
MRQPLLLATALFAGVTMLPAAPAQAQLGERVLTIFGNDPCPTSNGEEIVVCRRLDENERYRIPKDLRDPENPANLTWGDRAKSIEYVGANGVQSCSPVGAGGASGCFKKIVREARQEQHIRGEEPSIPLKLP